MSFLPSASPDRVLRRARWPARGAMRVRGGVRAQGLSAAEGHSTINICVSLRNVPRVELQGSQTPAFSLENQTRRLSALIARLRTSGLETRSRERRRSGAIFATTSFMKVCFWREQALVARAFAGCGERFRSLIVRQQTYIHTQAHTHTSRTHRRWALEIYA